MKLFELNMTTLMLRFYLLMGIVIGAGFSGYWSLALLALPVFFSALVGLKISRPVFHFQSSRNEAKQMHHQTAH